MEDPQFDDSYDVDIYDEATPRGVGLAAIHTLAALRCYRDDPTHLERPEPHGVMAPDDDLQWALRLEDAMQLVNFDDPDEIRNRRILAGHFADWHAALPLSESERMHVLAVQRVRGAGLGQGELMRAVAVSPDVEVVAEGIRRRVVGVELVHRWCIWRQGVGPYAEQGSLDQAYRSLKRIAAVLLPEDELGSPTPDQLA
jgi:hypothetical protein